MSTVAFEGPTNRLQAEECWQLAYCAEGVATKPRVCGHGPGVDAARRASGEA